MSKKAIIISVIIGLFLGLSVGGCVWFVKNLPHMDKLLNYQHNLATVVYDKNGKVMGEYYIEKRKWTSIDNISENIIKATLAVEDRNFEHHWGINVFTIFRAIVKDLIKMKKKEGGSTITQQLATDMFLSKRNKTFFRKIQEAFLTIEIEKLYSKDEILEMYLNQIYYGQGAYGVESAAEAYFSKQAKDLTLTEASMIVGIPKYPSKYNPRTKPKETLRRRNIVLEAVAKAGYIDEETAKKLKNKPLNVIIKEKGYIKAPYYMEEIRKFLISRYGDDVLYKGGLNVYASCDLRIQKKAEEIFEDQLRRREIERHYRFNITNGFIEGKPLYLQGALLVEDSKDGSILAMIGGRNFNQSPWNRSTQTKRQVGSSFKPIIYLSAIDNGFSASDIVLDAPIVVEIKGVKDEKKRIYKPPNFDNKFMGPVTLRYAISHSRNLATIRLMQRIGPYTVIDYANKCGITEKLYPYLSLALGSASISLINMVSAYQTFSNEGTYIKPHIIDSIIDKKGNLIYETNIEKKEVVSKQSIYITVSMMESVINEGTGHYARVMGLKVPVAGKTGTTDNFTDAWFIGFNEDIVCGVWIGFDSLRTMGRDATGAVMALPIWAYLMKSLIQGDSLVSPIYKRGKGFSKPEGITERRICTKSGLLASSKCPKIRNEYFINGNEPKKICDIHIEDGITNSGDYITNYNKIETIEENKEKEDEIFH
jgi:penicillin-binding protein 1A